MLEYITLVELQAVEASRCLSTGNGAALRCPLQLKTSGVPSQHIVITYSPPLPPPPVQIYKIYFYSSSNFMAGRGHFSMYGLFSFSFPLVMALVAGTHANVAINSQLRISTSFILLLPSAKSSLVSSEGVHMKDVVSR